MATDFPQATDILGALKGLFLGSPGAVAAFPGGFHADDTASPTRFPYLIAEQGSGPVGWFTEAGQWDDVRFRFLSFSDTLASAVASLAAWEAALKAGGGLTWASGEATIPRRMDRSTARVKERTFQGQRLESAVAAYLYRVRQD